MRNPALQNTIGAQTNRVEVALCFQHLVEVRDGEGGITPKEPHQVTIRVSCNDRLQNALPVIRAVHIAGPQGAAFKMTKLVEDEQRVIAHAAEVPVPGGALLRAVDRADRTVHVQRDPFGRLALMNPVDPVS